MTRVRLNRRVLLSAQVRTALTIAGSDSGGGAGTQAALKSCSSSGVHGTRVVSCVTAQDALVDRLFDRAALVTPNRYEAERLSGLPIRDVTSMEAAARAIRRLGPQAVLVKGGHLKGPLVDVLFDGVRMVRLGGRRYRKALHGAGCTLAASTAAYLALGHPLLESVRRARRKVAAGFRASYRAGHGVEIINSQITGGR